MLLRREYLPAAGPAQQSLVLLHGWGCNREVWRPLLATLRPWADVTLLDLPGCAPGDDSCRSPALPELLAGILDCAPERAVYVGWSLGGQLAIALAALAPERVQAFVTICTNPSFVAIDDWPGMDADAFCGFRAAVEAAPPAALRRFDLLQVTGSPHPRQLVRELRRLCRGTATRELLAGLEWLQSIDQREALSALHQPQLHVLAQDDALVPVRVERCLRSAVAHTASAVVKVIHGASHLALLDSPRELGREILGFLGDCGLLRAITALPPAVAKQDVAMSFSRAAETYDAVAQLQREVGEQLLTLLDGLKCAPANVLDLGCGTGYFRRALRERYAQAHYIGLDIAAGMVSHARAHSSDDSAWLVADAETLPLASASIDLVFSSLALQWCDRPEHLFAEFARVLRPGGVCVFTTLGPSTLYELREAWAAVDARQHVNSFLPVSDLLRAARVPGITVRCESSHIRLQYARVRELLDELKALGAHNMNRGRLAGLTGRRALQGMLHAYECRRAEGLLPATYDVIYGVVEKA